MPKSSCTRTHHELQCSRMQRCPYSAGACWLAGARRLALAAIACLLMCAIPTHANTCSTFSTLLERIDRPVSPGSLRALGQSLASCFSGHHVQAKPTFAVSDVKVGVYMAVIISRPIASVRGGSASLSPQNMPCNLTVLHAAGDAAAAQQDALTASLHGYRRTAYGPRHRSCRICRDARVSSAA